MVHCRVKELCYAVKESYKYALTLILSWLQRYFLYPNKICPNYRYFSLSLVKPVPPLTKKSQIFLLDPQQSLALDLAEDLPQNLGLPKPSSPRSCKCSSGLVCWKPCKWRKARIFCQCKTLKSSEEFFLQTLA